MESYYDRPDTYLPLHPANLEAETAGVLTGATTESEPPIETRVVRAPEMMTLHDYMLQLETLLGRRWDEDDLIRTRDRLAVASNHSLSLEDEVEDELLLLGGEIQERERLAVTLLGYYRLWMEADMEMATEILNSVWVNFMQDTDEESERSLSRPYEEIILEQLKTLKTREFDGEDKRHENKEICSVCLEDLYRGTVVTLDCHHEFHLNCIRRWLLGGRNICPLCRVRAIHH